VQNKKVVLSNSEYRVVENEFVKAQRTKLPRTDNVKRAEGDRMPYS
jgi:hypothetical protein